MKNVLLSATFVALWTFAVGRRGFILTAPREFKAGGKEKVCLTFNEVESTVAVRLELQHVDNTTINSKEFEFESGHGDCVEIHVPANLAWKTVQLFATGEAEDDYEFTERKSVQVRNVSPLITFVQTDKPIYKPGQLVQFRVLSLNDDLTPVLQTISQVIIEDPKRTRVMQWKDIPTEKGLASFKFPLSTEPVLGKWTIKVTLEEQSDQQTFKVDEYVLPKYEVKVDVPSFIYIDDETFDIEICAKYTYGKPVKGLAAVTTMEKTPYRSYYQGEPRPVINSVVEVNGCGSLTLNATELKLRSSRFPLWNAEIQVMASLKETATGVTLLGNGTSKISRKRYKIDVESYTDKYFKPGLPYTAKGRITTPDGQPAPHVNIKVEVTAYKPKINHNRFIKSDKNGYFAYNFTPMGRETQDFNIYASTTDETDDKCRGCHQMLSTQTNMHVKQWYSPSGSSLSISNEANSLEVECGYEHNLKINYLADPPSKHTFYYEVISRGKVVGRGHYVHEWDVTPAPSSIWDILSGKRRRRRGLEEEADEQQGEEGSEEEEGEEDEDAEEPDTPKRTILSPRDPTPKPKIKTTTPEPTVTPPAYVTTFLLSIKITPEMSPLAKIIVYYIREDGEVVSDSVELQIKKCLANKVEMEFDNKQVRPGDEATLRVKGDPGSLCSVGVVDKSVHLLGQNNQLNPGKVFAALEKFNIQSASNGYGRDEYCEQEMGRVLDDPDAEERFRRRKRSSVWPGAASRYVDASWAFKDTGMLFMSDLDVNTRPCDRQDYWYRAYAVDSVAQPEVLARGGETDEDSKETSPSRTEEATRLRSYFPETWLWDLKPLGPSGETEISKKAPDTITEWVASAFCSNTESGFGVAEPASLKVFMPFFASFTLPYSVIRGEIVPVLVTVFNYLQECLVIDFTLTRSEHFSLLHQTHQRTICVCADELKSVTFKIEPKTLATIDITVSAETSRDNTVCGNDVIISNTVARDIVTRKLIVEPEGAKDEYTFSALMCPSESNGAHAESIVLPLPSTLIPGSARGFVSVIGDIMGPTLSGLDKLLRLPTGCGEQNMLNFAPNIFVLQYLEGTRQITEDIRSKAIDFMRIGYQRELTYRHDDGSYSAFGDHDPSGSTWLTAFVVKSFAQAKPYITIDEEDLEKSFEWFWIEQQEEDGCIPLVGRVLHKGMKGGLADGNASPATLTAYVLISMLEGGEEKDSPVVDGALRCIDNSTISDTYSKALVAYAYTLYDPADPRTSNAMQVLEDAAIIDDDGYKHWEQIRAPAPPKPDGADDAWVAPYKQATSADVEMTAYALMAYLVRGGKENIVEVMPIVQWLTKQRNGDGGFSSTQDTVVALQALAKYAGFAYRDGVDMGVEVTAEGFGELFTVGDENSLLLQKRMITVPNELHVNAQGFGCALMQANVKFNVEVTNPPLPPFNIKASVMRMRVDSHCKKRLLDICVKYNLDDGKSNMAVVEIRMISGWVAVKESVDKLTKQRNLKLKRYEIDNNVVNLYFDEFDQENQCFILEINQEIDVEMAKPGLVNVYDYYKTENSVIHAYSIRPYCGTKLELPFNSEGPDDQEKAAPEHMQRRLPPLPPPETFSRGRGGVPPAPQMSLPKPQPLASNMQRRPDENSIVPDGEVTVAAKEGTNVEEATEESSETTPVAEPEATTEDMYMSAVEPTIVLEPTSTETDAQETMTESAATTTSESVAVETTTAESAAVETATTESAAVEPTTAELSVAETTSASQTTVATEETMPKTTKRPTGNATEAELVPGCPICPETQPMNFKDRYCAYDFAYKINRKGPRSLFPIKVMANLRPESGKVYLGIFAKYKMAEGCVCSPLTSAGLNDKLLILANNGQMKVLGERMGLLTLQDHNVVVALTREIENIVFYARVRRECSKRSPPA